MHGASVRGLFSRGFRGRLPGTWPAHATRVMMRTSSTSIALLLLALGALGLGACAADEVVVTAAPPATATRPEPEPTPEPPTPEPPTPTTFEPTFPVVGSMGGPVIKAPRVVPVVFAGDPLTADIESFTKKLGASKFWPSVATEYGVGALTASAPIVIDEQPPASLTSQEVETWLASKLTGVSPALGAPDPNALYALFYPAGVTITMEDAGAMGQSCEGYGGYHYELAAGSTRVGYAVMPRCSGIDDLTVTTSHEIFEWATDPFPSSAPAFTKLDDDHWAWQATMIGELGDLCTFLDQDYPRPTDIGFAVQRFWSNKLSLAGSFPCAPDKAARYVQAIPRTPDEAIVPDYSRLASNITTRAIRVKPGTSRTVDVLVYGDQAGGKPVTVRALGIDELYGRPSSTGFSYAVPSTPAAVGSTMKLEIEAPSDVAYDLLVMMTMNGAREATFWPVLVTNDDAANVQAGRPTVTPEALPRFAGSDRRSGGPRLTRLGLGWRVPGRP
jgi:hypothetical protein